MKKIITFEKDYDGEDLYDLERDIIESFDEKFNPIVKKIPQTKDGFQKGIFKVTVEWNPEGGIEE